MMKGWIILLAGWMLLLPGVGFGAENILPSRYGLGANLGLMYDPGSAPDFVQISGFALFDYDAVWPHRAPEPLRFKVETNAGLTTASKTRAMVSANIFALYFLEPFRSAYLRPYVEAGIGLIYTDFQVEGQGLRFNFNPQAGIGTEIESGNGPPWFAALRLHHLSNAGLDADNRGLNAVVFHLGRFLN